MYVCMCLHIYLFLFCFKTWAHFGTELRHKYVCNYKYVHAYECMWAYSVCVCVSVMLAVSMTTCQLCGDRRASNQHTHTQTRRAATHTHARSFALIECECLINSNSSMTWGKRVWPASCRRPTYHSGANAYQRPISRKSIGRIFCTMTTAI